MPGTRPKYSIQTDRLPGIIPKRVQIPQPTLHTFPNRTPLNQQTITHRAMLPLHLLILSMNTTFFAHTRIPRLHRNSSRRTGHLLNKHIGSGSRSRDRFSLRGSHDGNSLFGRSPGFQGGNYYAVIFGFGGLGVIGICYHSGFGAVDYWGGWGALVYVGDSAQAFSSSDDSRGWWWVGVYGWWD